MRVDSERVSEHRRARHTGSGRGPGTPQWPDDPRYDPELLAHGDTRNVIDHYRYWRMEAIVADLDTQRHPFHVAIENWQHDMNIGSIVRSANAFLADAVHIIGRRRWNHRGAMVTDRYQHVVHHEDVAAFAAWAAGAGLPDRRGRQRRGRRARSTVPNCRSAACCCSARRDPGSRAKRWPRHPSIVEITQYGSTRSINASAAAAVVMYEWCRRWAAPTS